MVLEKQKRGKNSLHIIISTSFTACRSSHTIALRVHRIKGYLWAQERIIPPSIPSLVAASRSTSNEGTCTCSMILTTWRQHTHGARWPGSCRASHLHDLRQCLPLAPAFYTRSRPLYIPLYHCKHTTLPYTRVLFHDPQSFRSGGTRTGELASEVSGVSEDARKKAEAAKSYIENLYKSKETNRQSRDERCVCG